MRSGRAFLPILFLSLGLSSCMITDQIKTLQVEVMKPGIFNIPKDLSVAVINRDLFRSDTCTFYYSTGYLRLWDTTKDTTVKYHANYNMVKDTSIKYRNLSDTCVNALINHFEEEGYFQKVIKPDDSLNHLLSFPDSIKTRNELFEKTKSDVCIFLDYFRLNTTFNGYFSNPCVTKANLIWTVAFKTDSLAYSYNLADTLFYDLEQVLTYSKYKDKILEQLLINSCKYLGRSFGTKVIPSWMPVERIYYKSRNTEMIKAEKYALNQDWIKAAEIWNKETKNKNNKIVAKACYNMALACEMEGLPDAAIDWLVKSYSSLEKNNEEHRANCQRYVNVLALRKKEIDRLQKQINRTENSAEN